MTSQAVPAHPAETIDVRDAALRFWTSLTGGEHWDRLMVGLRPELADSGSEHAQYTLDACVDERLTDEEDLDPSSELARAVLKTWCDRRAETCAAILRRIPVVDGHIQAHRMIACAPEDLRPELGLFWSHDLDNWPDPYAPWAEGDRNQPTLVVDAMVPVEAVDWQVSCMALMDWFCGDCESELRLRQGFAVRIAACSMLADGARVDVPEASYTT